MKTYIGYRRMHLGNDGQPTTSQCHVKVRTESGKTRLLRPRLDIRNHSPAGFEWGYEGSGPAQLALALVADIYGKQAAQPSIYQRVKRVLIAHLPRDGWELTEWQVICAVETARKEFSAAQAREESEANDGTGDQH